MISFFTIPQTIDIFSLFNPRLQRQETAVAYTHTSGSNESVIEFQGGKKSHHVQFGSPSAMEYDEDSCSQEYTPMPEEKVKWKYSMNPIKQTPEEEEITIETKYNNVILSEWEDVYESDNGTRRKVGGRAKSRYKKGRRESSFFGQATRLSLQNECHNGGMDVCNQDMSSIASTTDNSIPTSPELQLSESLALAQMDMEFCHQTGEVVTDGENSREFDASLRSINSSGAACTLVDVLNGTSDSMKTSTSEVRTNFPPLHIKWDKFTMGEKSMYDSHNKDWSTDEDIIIKTIYQQPTVEKPNSVPCILQTLSRLDRNARDNFIKVLLPTDPYALNSVSILFVCFLKNIFLSTEARRHETMSEEGRGKAAIDKWDWERVEYPLVIEILARMRALDDELTSLLALFDRATTDGSKFCNVHHEMMRLENEIKENENHHDVIEALLAPRAAMLCHATAFVSMSGFDLESFDDGEFVLKWEHMEGLESRVTYRTSPTLDFNIHSFCAPWTKATTEVRQLHSSSTNLISTTLKEEQGSLELCFSVVRMSKLFAKLDQIFLAATKPQ
jgi:hypothetical protein